MKWFVVLLAVCLMPMLALAGEFDANSIPIPESISGFTFRLMTDLTTLEGEIGVETKFGWRKDESEVGFIFGINSWEDEETKDIESDYSVGIFAMAHLPDLRDAFEMFAWPIEWLPESIKASPAFGVEALVDLDGKGVRTSPILELTVYKYIAFSTQYNFFTEDSAGDSNQWQVGVSFLIKQ